MRALCLTATGGPEHLTLLDLPAPGPLPDDAVRIRVRAVALNHLDLWVATGLPGVPVPAFPHVVGTDAAGEVLEVGGAVTGFAPGDRVVVNPGTSCGGCAACRAGEEVFCRQFGVMGEHGPGTAAEELVVPARNLGRLEGSWEWAEAAAFPLATLTAWRMLATRAALRDGESVLIWGIGGGVALQALQIAHHLGARVLVTSSSGAKLERAATLGAELGLDHGDPATVPKAVKAHLGGGVDVVVDSVGEATWEHSLRALRPGGRLVTCGATTGPAVGLDLRRLFWFQWTLLGSTMGTSREFEQVVRIGNAGALRPVVDRVFPVDDAATAYRHLADGAQFGKVVLTLD